MRTNLIEPSHFDQIWRLYFESLTIESVECADAEAKKKACGQTVYMATRPITVTWSDGRKDFCEDGNVEARSRVDSLVHLALDSCINKEQLIELLMPIQLNLCKSDYILSAWSRLYRHLTTLKLFDDDINRILFEHLSSVNMRSPLQIVEFIKDLFEIWPQVNNQKIIESFAFYIAQLIQKIIAFNTNESCALVEQLVERICALTPAQNSRGHLLYYFLLNETLILCNSANLTSAIKKVDLSIIVWYTDHVLSKSDHSEQHQPVLLSIVKHISMFTQHDLLNQWIERAASQSECEEMIIYELIENSLCPTSTLPIYVLHSSADRIDQLLKCVRTPGAIKYVNNFLLIAESLANSDQAQKYLFRSNFYLILQSWLNDLSSDTDQSTAITVRILHLLLEIGSSRYFKDADKIADFLLVNYINKMMNIDFENNSPLSNIILFLSSCSKTSSSPEITHIFTLLFESLKGEASLVAACTSHLTCLSKDIIKPSLQHILISYFTPLIAQLMGLLGCGGQLKLAATIILAEVLNLSSNEREVLALNVVSTNDIDSDSEQGSSDYKMTQHMFFSADVTNKQDYAQVRREDFVNAGQLLNALKMSELKKMDNHLRNYLPGIQQPLSSMTSSTSNDSENTVRLTLTETALENISKVMEVVNDPVPILLEGSTGVGKSASIMEAAYLCGQRELVRYNMSSRVSIDDLLGKVALVFNEKTESTVFQFVEGPFTKAFANGYWLLLDELNLAQDTVLQAIESALDTCQLTINNTSSSQDPVIIHRKHNDFRLFATQNPNSGFFKGKREKLSASSLSRFRPMIFKEMPDEEWRQIVEIRLKSYFPERAKSLSEDLVHKFNVELKQLLKKKNFEEIGPYTEISIRELLKWINLLIWQKEHNEWPSDIGKQCAVLSFSAWCIYGARYRHKGRDRIKQLLKDLEWPEISIHSIKFNVNRQYGGSITFDDIHCSARVDTTVDNIEQEWARTFQLAGLSIEFKPNIWNTVFQIHTDIHHAILTDQFISSHGIYRINRAWLWEWLVSAGRSSLLEQPDKLIRHGLTMYQSRFRHIKAREIIK
ncbi:unnamed protein product, partial [Rotaria magnacalcarata]